MKKETMRQKVLGLVAVALFAAYYLTIGLWREDN